MTETDAEHRDAPDELANIFHGVIDGLGVAGAVGEKHAVGAHAQNFFGGGVRRNDRDVAVVIHEQTQNVLLDAVIVGHHFEFRARLAVVSRFAHLLGPRRSRQINRAFMPHRTALRSSRDWPIPAQPSLGSCLAS